MFCVFVVFLMETRYFYTHTHTHTHSQRFIQFLCHFQMLKVCFPCSSTWFTVPHCYQCRCFSTQRAPLHEVCDRLSEPLWELPPARTSSLMDRSTAAAYFLCFSFFSYCRKSLVLSAREETSPNRPQASLCSSPQKRSRLKEQVKQNRRQRRAGWTSRKRRADAARAPDAFEEKSLGAVRRTLPTPPRPEEREARRLPNRATRARVPHPVRAARPDPTWATSHTSAPSPPSPRAAGVGRERRAPLTTPFSSSDASRIAHSSRGGGVEAAGSTTSNLRLRMRSYWRERKRSWRRHFPYRKIEYLVWNPGERWGRWKSLLPFIRGRRPESLSALHRSPSAPQLGETAPEPVRRSSALSAGPPLLCRTFAPGPCSRVAERACLAAGQRALFARGTRYCRPFSSSPLSPTLRFQ